MTRHKSPPVRLPVILVILSVFLISAPAIGGYTRLPDIYLHNQPFGGAARLVNGQVEVSLQAFLQAMGKGWRYRGRELEILRAFDPAAPPIRELPAALEIEGRRLELTGGENAGVVLVPLVPLARALGAQVLDNPETGILDVVMGRVKPVSGSPMPQPATSVTGNLGPEIQVDSSPWVDLGEMWVRAVITNRMLRRTRSLWVRCSFLDDYGREAYGDMVILDPLEPGQGRRVTFHWRNSILLKTPYHEYKHQITVRELGF